MICFDGRYFGQAASDFISVRACLDDGGVLSLCDEAGAELVCCAWSKCRVSPRVGSVPRQIRLPEGGLLETTDNDAVDACQRRVRRTGLWRAGDAVERTPALIVVAFLGMIAVVYGYITWGVPALSTQVAHHLPDKVKSFSTQQAIDMMDRFFFKPSELEEARKDSLNGVMARAVSAAGLPKECCALLFRRGGAMSANAFALPDGTVMMTDELVALAEHDDELFGILVHELGHVKGDHGMRMALQSSFVTLTIIFVTQDLGQFGEVAVALPSVLLKNGYSRGFEREADSFAAETMVAAGVSPHRLADILNRLSEKMGEGEGGTDWMSTHPATPEREAFLRRFPDTE